MARKNVLKGLMEDAVKAKPSDEATTENPSVSTPAPLPRYTKGAIGAVSQSINELKTRAVIDLDPHMIDPGGIDDRLETLDADHKALMASLKTYGQQVPILVRPHPETPDRYQIVYGRRRVLALRDLGLPVRAMVRDLDDRELIMAQGQENSARKDLSFIEKANFSRQMRDAGYDRKAICDALHVDKTVISRMLAVADAIPVGVIEAIGSAPSTGRDRWLRLADVYKEADWDETEAVAIAMAGADSDTRFTALFEALTRQKDRTKKPPTPPLNLRGQDGEKLGSANVGKSGTTLKINAKAAPGFDQWLVENIDRIHREWKSSREE